jgi:hypothetical protein
MVSAQQLLNQLPVVEGNQLDSKDAKKDPSLIEIDDQMLLEEIKKNKKKAPSAPSHGAQEQAVVAAVAEAPIQKAVEMGKRKGQMQ